MKKVNNVKLISKHSFSNKTIFDSHGGDNPVLVFPGSDVTPNLKLNSNFFRCKEFSKDSNSDIIISAGCSVTFGVGLAENEIWPNILSDLIGSDDVVMHNISRPGWSAFEIIYNLFVYLRNFKKPSEIYLLLPDESRTSGYSFIENLHGTFIVSVNSENKDPVVDEEIMMSNAVHIHNYLFILEEYCRVQNIKLFISTWNQNNFINRNSEFLNNYYRFSSKPAEIFINNYQKENVDSRFVLLARDNSHRGVGYHKYWADMFYKIRQENL